jgi:uncharacterized protein (TIGR02246 family)
LRIQPVLFAAIALLPADRAQAQAQDSAAVAAVVSAYHAALQSGDSAAALDLLASDVIVVESGGVESREQYRAHHLPADMNYAKALPSARESVRVVVRGDAAWAIGTSRTTGTYRDREVNSAGAELMVLTREAAGWRIRAIHWSSRTIRPSSG